MMVCKPFIKQLIALAGIFFSLGLSSAQAEIFSREISLPPVVSETKQSCQVIAFDRLRLLIRNDISASLISLPNSVLPRMTYDRLSAMLVLATQMDVLKEQWEGGGCIVKAKTELDLPEIMVSLKGINEDQQRVLELEKLHKKISEVRQKLDALRTSLIKAGFNEKEIARYHGTVKQLASLNDVERGLRLEHQGRPQEALTAFTDSISKNRKELTAYLNRGRLSGLFGQCEQAISDFNKVLSATPKDVSARMGRGDAYACVGKYADAVENYNQVLTETPLYEDALYQRGGALITLGRYLEAVNDFSKVLKINPGKAMAYLKRGTAYSNLGRYHEAIDDYSHAVTLDLRLSKVYMQRGDAFRILGEKKKALDDYNMAIALTTGKKELYRRRAEIHAELGSRKELVVDKENAGSLSHVIGVVDEQTLLISTVEDKQSETANAMVSLKSAEWRETDGLYLPESEDMIYTSPFVTVAYERNELPVVSRGAVYAEKEDSQQEVQKDIKPEENKGVVSDLQTVDTVPNKTSETLKNESSKQQPDGVHPPREDKEEAVLVQKEEIGEKHNSEPATAAPPVSFNGVIQDRFGKPLRGVSIEMVAIPSIKTFSREGGKFTLDGIPGGKDFLLKSEMAGYLPLYISSLQYPPGKTDYPRFTMYSAIAGAESTAGVRKDPVIIESDNLSYERDTDTYRALGHVVITSSGDPGGVLTSDIASLSQMDNKAEASGNVVMRSGKDVIYGDRAVMDVETKKGSVYNGRMFMEKNHFYVKGDRIEKTGEASYFVENATATTCDGNSPDWSIKGTEMDVTIDGYGKIKHGRFLAKNMPVLYTPYLLFPVKTTRQSGFLFPYLSYSKDKLGFDVELPFYWAISKSMDATFYQRYMSERGFKEGVEFRYSFNPDSYGTFYADFLNDTKQLKETRGNISRDWQSGTKRWSVFLNNITTFSPGFYMRSDIAKVSDNWYFKDFSSHNYFLSNYSQTQGDKFRRVSFQGDESLNSLDSTVRIVKDWELYNLTALVKYTDDFTQQSNDVTLQKYPEISFSAIKQPIFKSPVNYELTSVYGYYYRVEGQKGHLYDIKPDISMPINLGRYAQLTPVVGWRGSFWGRDDNVTDAGTRRGNRQLFNMGGTLTTEVQRIFNVGVGNLEKIRHGIRPELTYTFIPYVDQKTMPNYVVPIGEQNTLTYALTNTLTARLKDKKGNLDYREFLRLKLSQTFDIKEYKRDVMFVDRDSRPFGVIDMELDVTPFQYLSFAARNKLNVNSGAWEQTNYDLTVSDWRGDSATVGYRYTRGKSYPVGWPYEYSYSDINAGYGYTGDNIKEINLFLKGVITKNWEVSYFQRRNENINQDTEMTFGLHYRRQCWSIRLSYSDKKTYDTAGVESPDRVFMVLISFYGLGAVGNL